MMEILIAVGGLIVFLVVIARPFWGFAFMTALLPITEALPSVPFATSLVSLLGAVACIGVILNIAATRSPFFYKALSYRVLGAGVLLVAWFTFSNTEAAWDGTRNWTLTFIQLLVLAWLASRVMVSPERQRAFMYVFAGSCLIAAGLMFTEVGGDVTNVDSMRIAGLFGGENSAARYLVIAFVFMFYMWHIEERKIVKVMLSVLIGIIVTGIVLTISRAGMLLLIIGAGLLFYRGGYIVNLRRWVAVIGLIGIVYLFVPGEYLDAIAYRTYRNNSATASSYGVYDVRSDLVRAGLEMWMSDPIKGVGIGQYGDHVLNHVGYLRRNLGAHNMYISMLSETGIFGALLLMYILWYAIVNLYRASKQGGKEIDIAFVWFVCLLLLALGGLLKHDHAEKMLWIFIGMSIPFSRKKKRRTSVRARSAPWLETVPAH